MFAELSSCFRCFSCCFTLFPLFFLTDVVFVCVCRCWPTEWTCPMGRWAASCAAAPDRHCSPASWCVTQICTHPHASTCCTTPSITSSWLPQSWWVLPLPRTPTQKVNVSSSHSRSWTLSDASRGSVSRLGWTCFVRVQQDEQKLRLLSSWCSI